VNALHTYVDRFHKAINDLSEETDQRASASREFLDLQYVAPVLLYTFRTILQLQLLDFQYAADYSVFIFSTCFMYSCSFMCITCFG